MPSRREFLHHALWVALGLWAGASPLWAAGQGNGGKYVVKRGDTLGEIARAHGTTVAALKQQNRLRSDLIRVGQTLTLPQPLDTSLLAGVIAATARVKVDSSRWRYIVAHHSAIEAGNAKTYGAEHRRRGMEHGLAYHFVIGNGRDSGDGEIEVGPRWIHQLRGGHVRKQVVNDTGIGICLVGNFQNHAPTPRQMAAFTSLVDWLRDGRVASRCAVTVHRLVDRNHTVCPGRHFPYTEMKRRYG